MTENHFKDKIFRAPPEEKQNLIYALEKYVKRFFDEY